MFDDTHVLGEDLEEIYFDIDLKIIWIYIVDYWFDE